MFTEATKNNKKNLKKIEGFLLEEELMIYSVDFRKLDMNMSVPLCKMAPTQVTYTLLCKEKQYQGCKLKFQHVKK